MDEYSIEVTPREFKGSAASRRCRLEGLIPCIVYSRVSQSRMVSVPVKAFTHLAMHAKSSQVITLKSSLGELNGKSAIVKEIQRDFRTGGLLHIDFQEISEFEEVTVSVGLKFVGEAPGVKLDGGILAMARHDVKIRCLPKLIPQELTVDVSTLHMGDSLHMRDLQVPPGVKLDEVPEESVVSVVAVHVHIEETVAAAPAEGEALAEGEVPAEGAAEGAPAAAPAGAEGEKGEKSGEKPQKGSEKPQKGADKPVSKGKEGKDRS